MWMRDRTAWSPGLGAVILLGCVGLTGCAGDVDTQVLLVRPIFGAFEVGPVHVGSTVLVRSSDGTALSLVAGLVNDGSARDDLTAMTVVLRDVVLGGTWAAALSLPRITADVPLPVSRIGDVQRLGWAGGPQLVVADSARALPAGVFAEVTLAFRIAGSLTMPVLVEPPIGEFAAEAPRT
jgi:hypothetical protein